MSQAKKILMIDDDDDLRDALVEQLLIIGEFEVLEAANAQSAIEKTKENDFDLLLLDVGLPDADGRELCKLLRKQGVKCPIVMLTGQDSDADTILGLDAGANDYVTKPFKFSVLLARMRAQLRQHEQSEDANFAVGPYTFKPAHKVLLMQDGQKIRLTEKETNILKFLLRSADAIVARDTYCMKSGGIMPVLPLIRLRHIYRLRQKIEPDPARASLLITESGGYKLVALTR